MNEETDPLKLLYDEYKECKRCPLSEHRKNIVFGSGNRDASILLVTDSPTLVEDRLGHHNTTDMRWTLRAFKHAIGRDSMPIGAVAELFFEKCFVTSATMCTRKMIAGDNIGQPVEPGWAHIKKCRDRLLRTIYEVDPLIIVAAGKFAVQALMGQSKALPARNGKVSGMFTVNVPGELGNVTYSAIPSYDPHVAERRGDYDDETGAVSAFTTALTGAWRLLEYLEREDQ